MGPTQLMFFSVGISGVMGAVSANGIAFVNKKLIKARNMDDNRLMHARKRAGIETLLFIVIFMFLGIWTQHPLDAFYRMSIFTVLFGIGITDFYYRIIPNEYITAMAFLALIMLLSKQSQISPLNALAGSVVGGLIFLYPCIKNQTVGGGDVKLCIAAGLNVGLGGLLASLVFMGLLLLIYTAYKQLIKGQSILTNMVPLGPVLATSIFAQILLMDIIPNYARFFI
ncbi:MAG: prepilin peptidase [Eubacteriales bacterium]|nr:prepilin peptidase [Eubacteriales bacterium]